MPEPMAQAQLWYTICEYILADTSNSDWNLLSEKHLARQAIRIIHGR